MDRWFLLYLSAHECVLEVVLGTKAPTLWGCTIFHLVRLKWWHTKLDGLGGDCRPIAQSW